VEKWNLDDQPISLGGVAAGLPLLAPVSDDQHTDMRVCITDDRLEVSASLANEKEIDKLISILTLNKALLGETTKSQALQGGGRLSGQPNPLAGVWRGGVFASIPGRNTPKTRTLLCMAKRANLIEAYLFRCDDDCLFAVSIDSSGTNLPCGANTGPWRAVYDLRATEPSKADAPALLRKGLRQSGYFIWREGVEQTFQ
jgi:hypothetical protein